MRRPLDISGPATLLPFLRLSCIGSGFLQQGLAWLWQNIGSFVHVDRHAVQQKLLRLEIGTDNLAGLSELHYCTCACNLLSNVSASGSRERGTARHAF